MNWHTVALWAAVYVVAVTPLGVVLGKRIKQCREAQERLDAMHRRHLGL